MLEIRSGLLDKAKVDDTSPSSKLGEKFVDMGTVVEKAFRRKHTMTNRW